MWSKLLRAILVPLVSFILLGPGNAGRMSDFARRKGFGAHLASNDWEEARTTPWGPDDFRFLTPKTTPYLVTSLPEVPFNIGEMYAGLIPVDMKNASRALYYVFQPTVGAPVDEITIWLNGGPGCSSLEGFFQENGRFVWQYGMYSPQINPYSWVNLTNMLWVEQPVGTGFSIGEVTATSEEDIAEDFVNWFLNFQNIFGIKNFKIYVTGESYAGRFVPYISAAMLDKNNTENFNLSGAITYDPCIGSYDYVQSEVTTYPFIIENNAMLGYNQSFLSQMEALDETCGYAAYREKYFTFPPSDQQPPTFFNYSSEADLACDVAGLSYDAACNVNPCYNVYETGTQCPLLSDPLGYPTGLLYSDPGLTPVYFDRLDVKTAMHAPPDIDWTECSNGDVFIADGGWGGPEQEGDLSPDPIQSVLPRVIEATNRVLIANGQLDMIILTNGTLLSIQNMTWNGKLGFQQQPSEPIVITLPDLQYGAVYAANGEPGAEDPMGIMGVQHYERGLMWAETYLSGHMEPQFQPRSSYRHLQWLLGHIETL